MSQVLLLISMISSFSRSSSPPLSRHLSLANGLVLTQRSLSFDVFFDVENVGHLVADLDDVLFFSFAVLFDVESITGLAAYLVSQKIRRRRLGVRDFCRFEKVTLQSSRDPFLRIEIDHFPLGLCLFSSILFISPVDSPLGTRVVPFSGSVISPVDFPLGTRVVSFSGSVSFSKE